MARSVRDMFGLLIDSFKDALFDTVKLIPFLFITYVIMEWLERKTAGRQANVLKKAEKLGPLLGGVLGIVPQCGFSLMASNLYSGGVIGAGVLIAVFMSTSDEMLPIMLSNDAISAGTIAKILVTKAVIAVITGYIVGFVLDRLRKPVEVKRIEHGHGHVHQDQHGHMHGEAVAENTQYPQNIVYNNIKGEKNNGGHVHDYVHEHSHDHGHYGEKNIHEVCEQEHCDCEGGVLRSALVHTAKIAIFIFIFTLIINIAIELVGEDTIARIFNDVPVLGEASAALVGLIPNCAASVIITELYLQGILSAGAMMSGLLVSAGVGLVVLFRMNRHRPAENIRIAAVLYAAGLMWGLLINAAGITF